MRSAKKGLVVDLCSWTFVLLGVAACDTHSDSSSANANASATATAQAVPEPVQPAPPSNEQLAKQIYAMRCVSCHGTNGKGDGKMAAMLTPKPRDYSDPTWQASITDDAIGKVILGGGASVGKSAVMPANEDLGTTPDVVAALVAMVRSFGKANANANDGGTTDAGGKARPAVGKKLSL